MDASPPARVDRCSLESSIMAKRRQRITPMDRLEQYLDDLCDPERAQAILNYLVPVFLACEERQGSLLLPPQEGTGIEVAKGLQLALGRSDSSHRVDLIAAASVNVSHPVLGLIRHPLHEALGIEQLQEGNELISVVSSVSNVLARRIFQGFPNLKACRLAVGQDPTVEAVVTFNCIAILCAFLEEVLMGIAPEETSLSGLLPHFPGVVPLSRYGESRTHWLALCGG